MVEQSPKILASVKKSHHLRRDRPSHVAGDFTVLQTKLPRQISARRPVYNALHSVILSK